MSSPEKNFKERYPERIHRQASVRYWCELAILIQNKGKHRFVSFRFAPRLIQSRQSRQSMNHLLNLSKHLVASCSPLVNFCKELVKLFKEV